MTRSPGDTETEAEAIIRALGLEPHPEGGFYVFPDVSRCLSAEIPDTLALCGRLLEEKAVAVVPGEGFHAPGFFRLSFAAAFEDLQEGARRIAEFLAEHAPRKGGRR